MSLFLIDHLYVLVIAVVFLWVILKSQPKVKHETFTTKEKIGMYWSNSLFLYLVAAIAVLIWWWPGRSLADIGFQMPGENVLLYLGLTLAFGAWYVYDVMSKLVSPRKRQEAVEQWRRQTPFMPENRSEVSHSMQLAVSAGVSEEIVFRGFLITYFVVLLTGSLPLAMAEPLSSWQVWLAIVIPAIMFGLCHMYLGWAGVFKVMFLSLMFGAIFVASGSLLLVILAHIFVDAFALLISPWVMAQTARQPELTELPV
ncbi:MAG: CPBP family intramembrane glutamic endopeptidase [Pirellulaceae bacterium]